MRKNEEINAGDYSANVQGDNATVTLNHIDADYTKVKEIVMDIFKMNFYDLGEKAAEIAKERAEYITNKYIEGIKSIDPELIKNTEDPDMRYAIYEAQKNYARLGDKETADLLIDLLIDRTKSNNISFERIVLNEALTIIPKLTAKQIDTLSLIYLVKYFSYNPILIMPFEHYYSMIQPYLKIIEISSNPISYQQLQYSGCASISIGSSSFEDIMKYKFPHLFKNSEELNQVICECADLINLKNNWDNTKLCCCSLTGVGIAIALSNLKIKIGPILGNLRFWLEE